LSWHLNTTVGHFLADDRSFVEHAFAQADLTGSVDVEATHPARI